MFGPGQATLFSKDSNNRATLINGTIQGWLFYSCSADSNEKLKHRWFAFSNENNQIEYFSNPKDLNRVGAISVETAAFNMYPTRDINKLFTLEIISDGSTHKLLHEEEEELLKWKSFLQNKRHSSHINRIDKGVSLVENVPVDSSVVYQSRFGAATAPKISKMELIDFRRLENQSKSMDSVHEPNVCKGPCENEDKYQHLLDKYETLLELFELYKKCLDDVNEPGTEKLLNNILHSIDRIKIKTNRESLGEVSVDSSQAQKYSVVLRERNLYKRQNSILQAELVNMRRYWAQSVNHEHFLIVGFERIGPVYRKQREIINIAMNAFKIDLNKMKFDKTKADDAYEYFENIYKTVIKQTDEYGFFQNYDIVEKLNCLQELENVSNGFQYLREADTSVFDKLQLERWNKYIESWDDNQPLQKDANLKSMLRNGVPSVHRGRVWEKLTQLFVRKVFEGVDFREYYYGILNKVAENNPFSKQIDLDIQRTLPENIFFEVPEASDSTDSIRGSKLPQLRNILLAFSHEHRDSIGYCQGLDRLAAILLLNMSEEMAFWSLIMIVNRLRPSNYYTSSLLDAQADQRVFKALLSEQIPILSKKLEDFNVDISLFAFKWFLTMFVDGFSWKIYMKIWDAFLYEGDKIIFRYAMAIMVYLEPLLIYQDDLSGIMKILRSAGHLIKDHCRLTHIAFHDLRAFPKRRISQKRLNSRMQIEEEQSHLNIQRIQALKDP